MKDLLIRIAQALVDNPKKVRVNEIEGGQTVVLELRVAKTYIERLSRLPPQRNRLRISQGRQIQGRCRSAIVNYAGGHLTQ